MLFKEPRNYRSAAVLGSLVVAALSIAAGLAYLNDTYHGRPLPSIPCFMVSVWFNLLGLRYLLAAGEWFLTSLAEVEQKRNRDKQPSQAGSSPESKGSGY